MKSPFKISEDLSLPLDAVTQTIAIVARKRVGKTYTASVIAEEFIGEQIPTVILDPTGAWWGLRSSSDGKRDGLPVIIIGGAHADVPLEETAGKLIADLVVDHPGYYIVDFSQVESDAAICRFSTDFAKRFYFRKEQKRFAMSLIIDEADVFAPQNPFAEQKRMLGAFDVIVRRGGIRGIGVIMITQRPAVLNKNMLTQSETLIALQISGSQDVDALEHWIRLHGTKEQRAEFLSTVGSLQMGVAWFWSPSWLQVFKRVNIRQRTTFNSSATPKAGEAAIVPTKLAKVDIDKLGREIAATVEKLKAEDPTELKRLLAVEKRRGNELEKQLEIANKKAPKTETKEVPFFSDAERKLLVDAQKHMASVQIYVEEQVQKTIGALMKIEKIAMAHRPFIPASPTMDMSKMPATSGWSKHNIDAQLRKEESLAKRLSDQGYAISGVQQKIVNAIAEMELLGVERPVREIVALMAGYTNLASTGYVKAISALRTSGHVEYPDSETIALTQSGKMVAHYPPVPRSSEEVQQRVCNIIGGKSSEILRPLIAAYPESCTRDDIAAASGYTNLASTGFVKAVSKLRTLGFISYPDSKTMRATDVLFLK